MSTLSQFSGGGIKSIQRGTVSLGTTGSTQLNSTATITAVNTAKTMLNFCGCSSNAISGGGAHHVARIALTSSTQVTATLMSSASAVVVVSYEVIEYF